MEELIKRIRALPVEIKFARIGSSGAPNELLRKSFAEIRPTHKIFPSSWRNDAESPDGAVKRIAREVGLFSDDSHYTEWDDKGVATSYNGVRASDRTRQFEVFIGTSGLVDDAPFTVSHELSEGGMPVVSEETRRKIVEFLRKVTELKFEKTH